MEKIKQEENIQLRKTISLIEDLIDENKKQIRIESEEIKDLSVISGDDYENFKYHQNQIRFYNREIEIQESILPSPYFARIDLADDLENDSTIFKYYIGKTELVTNLNKIILDWRSDIGSLYYQKNTIETVVDGKATNVLLRRVFDIEDKQLKSYKTEYSYGELDDESEIVDPFLVEVIRSNRKNKQLTDIIRSIQSEQIKIIDNDLNQNIVVQGCAGSGKTMILTHRLSSLIYKNRDITENDFAIITPNQNLNTQISNIAKTLEIQKIGIFTIFDFYKYLFDFYKTSFIDGSSIRENLSFDKRFSDFIYSDIFRLDLINAYTSRHELVVEKRELLRLQSLVDYLNSNVYSSSIEIKYSFNDLLSLTSTIINTYNEVESYVEELKEIIQNGKHSINELKTELKKEQTSLTIKKNELYSYLKEKIELVLNSCEVKNEQISTLIKRKALINRLGPEIGDIVSIENVINELKSIHTFCNNEIEQKFIPSNFSNFLSTISNELNTYFQLKNQISKTSGISGYFRRLSLTSKSSNILAQLKARITSYLPQIIKLLDILIEKEKTALSFDKNLIEVYSKLTEIKPENNWLNYSTDDQTLRKLLKDVFTYTNSSMTLNEQIQGKIIEHEKALKEEKKFTDFLKLKDRSFITDFRGKLVSIKKDDKNLFFSLIDQIFKSKFTNYIADFKTFLNKESIYARLLFCQIAFGKIRNPKYLFFDEGQSLSVNEYLLISDICANDTIFNIYGDTNQSINKEREILDWTSLLRIKNFTILLLNRNYRNTQQITEFCNQEFKLNVLPIGLSGIAVTALKLEEAKIKMEESLKKISTNRIAIIVKSKDLFKNTKIFIDIIQKLPISETGDINKIQLFDLNSIRGLEFETVFVLGDSMEKNEKYLSYTRALSELYLVKD